MKSVVKNEVRGLIVSEIRKLFGKRVNIMEAARRRVLDEVTFRGGGVFLDKPIPIVLGSVMGTLLILGYNPTMNEILIGTTDDYDSVPTSDLENDIDFESMSPEDIAALAAVEDRLGIDVPHRGVGTSHGDVLEMRGAHRLVPESIRRHLHIRMMLEAPQPPSGELADVGDPMTHEDNWIDVVPGDELLVDGEHVTVQDYDHTSMTLTYRPIDVGGRLGSPRTLSAHDAIDELGGGPPLHDVVMLKRQHV